MFIDTFEELSEETQITLKTYLASGEREVSLANLGVWQRKQVHMWAKRNGLYSSSINGPSGRVLMVTRNAREVPQAFLCPIAQTIMVDPVLTQDGFTYERTSIETWLRSHHKSPMTNLPLASTVLIANIALRQAIEEFKQ